MLPTVAFYTPLSLSLPLSIPLYLSLCRLRAPKRSFTSIPPIGSVERPPLTTVAWFRQRQDAAPPASSFVSHARRLRVSPMGSVDASGFAACPALARSGSAGGPGVRICRTSPGRRSRKDPIGRSGCRHPPGPRSRLPRDGCRAWHAAARPWASRARAGGVRDGQVRMIEPHNMLAAVLIILATCSRLSSHRHT